MKLSGVLFFRTRVKKDLVNLELVLVRKSKAL